MAAYFPLSSPISVEGDDPATIHLKNNSTVIEWDEILNSSGDMVFGNQSINEVLRLYSTGTAGSPQFRIRRDPNGVNLNTDPALSTTYTYNFPAQPPTGPAQVIASTGTTNVFYDVHAKNLVNVRKNPGPAEYSSIASAIASIPTVGPDAPTDTNRYVVYIYEGDYLEPQISTPSYVFLVGVSMQGVTISPASTGYEFITFLSNSGIAFVTIRNTDPAFPAFHFHDSGSRTICHKVVFDNCPRTIYCHSDGPGDNTTTLEYITTNNSSVYSIYAINTGAGRTIVNINNFVVNGHNDNSIFCTGIGSEVRPQSCSFVGDGTGIVIRLENGAKCDTRGLYVDDWDTVFSIPNDGSTPSLYVAGSILENCNTNINIQNANTIGWYSGYTEYSKTFIPDIAPFFITNEDQHIITVAYKGANFNSVSAALSEITSNNSINMYTIYVGPGVFVEPQLVLQPYIAIVGTLQSQTILMASDNTKPFIIGSPFSSISNLTLAGQSAPYPPYLIEYLGSPTPSPFIFKNIFFGNANGLVHINNINGNAILLATNNIVTPSSIFTTGVTVDDIGSAPSNTIAFIIDNFIWNPSVPSLVNFTNFFHINSTKSMPPGVYAIRGAIQDCKLSQQITQKGSFGILEGLLYMLISNCIIGGYVTGVSVPANSQPLVLGLDSNTFISNTTDIDIQNVNSSGSITSFADKNKVNIVTGASFGIVLTDISGNVTIVGQLYQGNTWDTETNISEQIQHASPTGEIESGQYISSAGGLNVNVPAGKGYVNVNSSPDDYLKYITWSANPSFSVPANQISWIYVDEAGVINHSASQPSAIFNVILGAVYANSTSIAYVQQIGDPIDNISTNIDQTLRNIYGPIVQSGCVGSPGSSLVSRAVQISSGSYNLSIMNYKPVSADNISMISCYGGLQHYPSDIPPVPFLTSVPLSWDNSGTLTALTLNQWAKHSIYLVTDNTGASTFFLVYGQQTFAQELDADDGPIPLPPTSFVGNVCPFVAVVVAWNDPNSPLAPTRFRDIRPVIGFQSSGVSASADHNSLLNLTVGNAHPQYFRVDGTESMQGNILLSTYNIVGSGGNLLNGVDITDHHTRHAPGGADALSTGTPVTIGTTNSPGVQASFAISDHVHAHGSQTDPTMHAVVTSLANGFMLSTDKQKLDASTPLDVPSTLVQRDANGTVQLSSVQFPSADNSGYYVSISPSPSIFGGPNHSVSIPVPSTDDTIVLVDHIQTLTNKTLTSHTNTISASQLMTTGADVVVSGSAPPSTNFALIANNSTSASWKQITNATLQNSSITISPGTGLSGGGLVSLGGTTTLNIANTTVVPGSYTNANITVNAQGQITTASSGPIGASILSLEVFTSSFTVTSTTSTTYAYLPWINSVYGAYTTRTVYAWVDTSTTTRGCTLSVFNGVSTLGSVTVPASNPATMFSYTISAPGANSRLEFRVIRSASGGSGNPIFYGTVMILS